MQKKRGWIFSFILCLLFTFPAHAAGKSRHWKFESNSSVFSIAEDGQTAISYVLERSPYKERSCALATYYQVKHQSDNSYDLQPTFFHFIPKGCLTLNISHFRTNGTLELVPNGEFVDFHWNEKGLCTTKTYQASPLSRSDLVEVNNFLRSLQNLALPLAPKPEICKVLGHETFHRFSLD
mgnify:CR=1 FL=1